MIKPQTQNGPQDATRSCLESGEGGIRTSPDFSTNLAISEQGSAESGALCLPDPRLGALLDAWPTLPEPIRAGILAMVRATGA